MINVVFMATPQIAVKSLDLLNTSQEINVCAVVTQTDKPSGRGKKIQHSPIKEYALEHGIKVFQPESIRKDEYVQSQLRKFEPDFFVTFAFGQILSQEVLDIPKIATVNLHASLLPRYRGANPIQRALINGDKETGICTMITELGLDSGDVCLSEKIPISDDMNFENLHDKVAILAPNLIKKTIFGLKSATIAPQKQDEQLVTFAKKLQKGEEEINFKNSAQDIHNLVRGIYKAPCAHFIFNSKRIKVLETKVNDKETKYEEVGKILSITKKGIEVTTSQGSIMLITIKPEGKGEMMASAWVNGSKVKVGDFIL